MATAPVSSPSSGSQVSDAFIEQRIEEVRRGLWRSELTRCVLGLLIGALGLLLAWSVVDQWIWSPGVWGRSLIAALALAAGVGWLWMRLRPLLTAEIDRAYAAYAIERDLPALQHALTSYVTLRPQRADPGLRGVVVRSIGRQAASRLRGHGDRLPQEAHSSFQLWMIVAAVLAALALYAVVSPKNTFQSAGRLLMPLARIDAPTRVKILEVTPGSDRVMAGRQVSVSARFAGLGGRDQPQLMLQTIGEASRRIEMRADDEASDLYHATLGQPYGLQTTTRYVVTAGDARSERFTIDVRDVPAINITAVRYQPPAYTGRPVRSQSAAAVEGLEGTRVIVQARTNRPIQSGRIEFNPRRTHDRTIASAGSSPLRLSEDGQSVEAEWTLRRGDSARGLVTIDSYRLVVQDAAGAENPEPVVYPVRVLPDLAPEVSFAVPTRSPKDVPVDAQQLIEVHALDPDFGLTELRLKLQRGVQLLAEPVLWSDAQGDRQSRVAIMRFRPAQWNLKPGHEITVTAVAKDNRHDSEARPAPNVTLSDPITLRIVEAAQLSENQPAEDGLTAADDQPAVDPQNNSDDASQDGQSDSQDGQGESQDGQGGQGGQGESQGGQGESQDGQGGSQDGQGESQDGQGQSQDGQGGQGESQDGQGGSQDGQGGSQDGQGGTQDGQGGAQDGQGGAQDGQGGAQDGQGGAQDGQGGMQDGQAGSQDGQAGSQDGQAGSQDGQGEIQDGAQDGQGGSQDGQGAQDGQGTMPEGQRGTQDGQAGSQDGQAGSQDGQGGSQDGQGGSQDGQRGTQDGQRGTQDGQAGTQDGQRGTQDGQGSQGTPDGAPDGQGTMPDGQRGPQDRQGGLQDGQGGPQDAEGGSQDGPGAGPDGDSPAATGEAAPGADGTGSAGAETGEAAGAEGGAGEQPGQRPETDAEAFERIKEHIEAMREQSGDAATGPDAASGSEAAGSSAEQAASSGSESGEGMTQPDDGQSASEAATDASSSPADAQQGDSAASAADAPESDAAESDAPGAPSSDSASGSQASGAEAGEAGEASEAGASESVSSSDASSASEAGLSSRGTAGTPADSDDSPIAPPEADPADLEYAKKATDMVLDYLNQTRDRPDEELLERLNWSEEDLRRFEQRWQQTRELARQPDGQGGGEFEEALRSLGLRRDNPRAIRQSDRRDALPGVEDAGTRVPAPPLYRDAFEAFRRSLNP